METKIFWGIFVIALVAGLALGTSVSNIGIIGKGVAPYIFQYGTDSDGGEVVNVPGTCTDEYGSYEDYCRSEGGNALVEFYLDNSNRCTERIIFCDNLGYGGCKAGGCGTQVGNEWIYDQEALPGVR